MVKERLAGITVQTQGEYQRVWNGNTEHTGRTEDKIELIRYIRRVGKEQCLNLDLFGLK